MDELVFAVRQEADGGFVAECVTKYIFTQADSWDELLSLAQEAVEAYCFDTDSPQVVCLALL